MVEAFDNLNSFAYTQIKGDIHLALTKGKHSISIERGSNLNLCQERVRGGVSRMASGGENHSGAAELNKCKFRRITTVNRFYEVALQIGGLFGWYHGRLLSSLCGRELI